MALSPIESLSALTPASPSYPPEPAAAGGAFDQMLEQVLGRAAAADAQATRAVEALASGQADDLHTASLALAQADLTFRLALAVRNRLLEGYQEIMRMQV